MLLPISNFPQPRRLLLVCAKSGEGSWSTQGRRPNPQRLQRRLQRHQQEQVEGEAEHVRPMQVLPAKGAPAGKGACHSQVPPQPTKTRPSSGASSNGRPVGKQDKQAQGAKPAAAVSWKLSPATFPKAKVALLALQGAVDLERLGMAQVQALYAIRGAQHPEQVVAAVEAAIQARQSTGCIFTLALEHLERLHVAAQQQRAQQRQPPPLQAAGAQQQRTGGSSGRAQRGPQRRQATVAPAAVQGHRGQHGPVASAPAPHRAGKAVKAARRAFAAVFDHAVDHLAHADPATLAVMARSALSLGHRVPPEQQSCIVAVLTMQLCGLCQRGIPGHCLATFIWATFGRWQLSADDQMALLRGVVSREGHLSEQDLDHVLLGLCRLRSQEGEGAMEPLQGGGAWDVVKLALDRWVEGGAAGAVEGAEGAPLPPLEAASIESVPLAAPAPDEEGAAAAAAAAPPAIGFSATEAEAGGMPAVLEGLLRGLREQQQALSAVAAALALHDGLHAEGVALPDDYEGEDGDTVEVCEAHPWPRPGFKPKPEAKTFS